ncbi:MAG: hypothetical protein AVDCRST_MAG93-5885, partial [uncultured Chloroflexia bacterium]
GIRHLGADPTTHFSLTAFDPSSYRRQHPRLGLGRHAARGGSVSRAPPRCTSGSEVAFLLGSRRLFHLFSSCVPYRPPTPYAFFFARVRAHRFVPERPRDEHDHRLFVALPCDGTFTPFVAAMAWVVWSYRRTCRERLAALLADSLPHRPNRRDGPWSQLGDGTLLVSGATGI